MNLAELQTCAECVDFYTHRRNRKREVAVRDRGVRVDAIGNYVSTCEVKAWRVGVATVTIRLKCAAFRAFNNAHGGRGVDV